MKTAVPADPRNGGKKICNPEALVKAQFAQCRIVGQGTSTCFLPIQGWTYFVVNKASHTQAISNIGDAQ